MQAAAEIRNAPSTRAASRATRPLAPVFWRYDPRTGLLSGSPGARALFGARRAMLLRLAAVAATASPVDSAAWARLLNALVTGARTSATLTLGDIAGHPRTVRIVCEGACGDGLIRGAILEDAAPLLVETAAPLQLEIMARAFDLSSMFAARLDRNLAFVWASETWIASFGLRGKNFIGRSIFDVIPMIPPHWREAYRQALAGKVSKGERDLYVSPIDGKRGWLRWNVSGWRTGAGDIDGVLIVGEDMTALVEAQFAAERVAERANLALELVRGGVWEADFKRDRVSYSPNMASILGRELPRRISESTGQEWVHPDDRHLPLEKAALLQNTGDRVDYETRIVRPDGEVRWVRNIMEGQRQADGTLERLLNVTIDITERKRADENLLRAMVRVEAAVAAKQALLGRLGRDAQQTTSFEIFRAASTPGESFEMMAARLEGLLAEFDARDEAIVQLVDDLAKARSAAEEASLAKSQFLANVSHELRTPLNAVIGYAELLEEDLVATDHPTGPDDLRRIQSAARQLLSLINEILDLSKIESGRLDLEEIETDFQQLARDAAELVAPAVQKNANTLVLDIGLPDMSGWEVLEALRADPLTSNTPVIVLTGLAERREALARGAVAHFTKPADRTALFEALNDAIGSAHAARNQI